LGEELFRLEVFDDGLSEELHRFELGTDRAIRWRFSEHFGGFEEFESSFPVPIRVADVRGRRRIAEPGSEP
jgi:hypothetical protein